MTPRAAAQSVALDLHACAEPAPQDVRAVLAVELHGQLAREDQPAPLDARVVEVRCTRDQAELSLRGTSSRRTLALASVPPELRARLLALAIAELARPPLVAAGQRTSPSRPATTGAGEARAAASDPPPDRGASAASTQRQRAIAAGRSGADQPASGAGSRSANDRHTSTASSQPRAADDRAGASSQTSSDAALQQPPAADTRDVADSQLPAADTADGSAASAATDSLQPRAAAADDHDDEEALTTPQPSAATLSAAPELEIASASVGRWLWIGAEVQATPLLGWGGAAVFAAKLTPWLAWSSALSLDEARADIDRGKLRVLAVSARTGLAWLAQGRRASFHAGAGVRGRWLKLTGEPSDATSTTAKHFTTWSLGPSLFAGTQVLVAGPMILALELELHHALREVKANVENGGSRTIAPWQTSAAVGAGLAW